MNTYSINGIEYEFECSIENDKGRVEFNKYAIKKMRIVDDLFSPFIQGEITFGNFYDLVEEDILIRGDGSDILKIMFKPKEDENDDVFEHSFILKSDQNMGNLDTRGDNYRNYSLIDINLVPFLENVPYNKTYSGNVGDILKQIFIEVLGEEFVDEEEWESCDVAISYTPPNTFRYIDLMKYLMPMLCVKEENLYVKAILKYNDGNGKFYLKNLSEVFAENDDLADEAFIISDLGGDTETTNPNNPPAGPEFAAYLNQLRNFQVSTPLYDWNNNYFLNYMVHGYDPMLGQFKIAKIEFSKVVEEWKKLFVDVFTAIKGKPKPFLPVQESANKRFKTVKFPHPVEYSLRFVISEICNTLIFYNLQCSFHVVGSGKRMPGRFVDIVKTGSDVIKSDEKTFGRWLVTGVSHEFLGETYKNTISGCKTYVGPESKL